MVATQTAVAYGVFDRWESLWFSDLQNPSQGRHFAHAADTLKPFHPAAQFRVFLQFSEKPSLVLFEELGACATELDQSQHRGRHVIKSVHQVVKIARAVELAPVILSAHFHEQAGSLVLQVHGDAGVRGDGASSRFPYPFGYDKSRVRVQCLAQRVENERFRARFDPAPRFVIIAFRGGLSGRYISRCAFAKPGRNDGGIGA